ncbi:MAG: hypothetical protein ACREQ4_05135 [Candidatus Binataceae bacterium]
MPCPVEYLARSGNYPLWSCSRSGCIDDGARGRGQPDSIADDNFGLAEVPRSRVDRLWMLNDSAVLWGHSEMNGLRHHVGKTKNVERTLV